MPGKTRVLARVASFVALMTWAAASIAADAPRAPSSVAEIAAYQGADRQERLVALAKKEGEVSVYHVYPNLPLVLDAFSKKYGIRIKAWRSGSEAVLQR